MADSNEVLELNFSIDNFKISSFEEQFKIALKWNLEQWEQYQLKDTRFQSVINSAKYWKKKLADAITDSNVILSLYSETLDTYINPEIIISAIEDLSPDLNVTDYNKFRNQRYLCVELENVAMKKFVLENLKKIDGALVYFLNWVTEPEEMFIRIHWISKGVAIDRIAGELGKYFNFNFVKREITKHKNGKQYGCGVLIYKGKLKQGISLDRVPHICMIGNLESLWVIGGRTPLCLRCNAMGHRSFQCKIFFCKKCKSRQLKEHLCNDTVDGKATYASVTKSGADILEDEEIAEWENQIQEVSKEEFYGTYGTPKEQEVTKEKSDIVDGSIYLSKTLSQNSELANRSDSSDLDEEEDGSDENIICDSQEKENTSKSFKEKMHNISSTDSSILGGDFRVIAKKKKETKKKALYIIEARAKLILVEGLNTYSKVTTRSARKSENLFDALSEGGGGGDNGAG